MNLFHIVLLVAGGLVLGFYLILNAFYLFLLVVSTYGASVRSKHARLRAEQAGLNAVDLPPVTFLIPAHNEELTIVESVRSLLGVRYPILEAIVINDGSTDDTLKQLIHHFSLRRADLLFDSFIPIQSVRGVYLSTQDPRLMVIDKMGGGKSDALNAGLKLCHTPWVCCVDADSILEEEALLRAIWPAIEDDTVVASGGMIRIANGCRVSGGRVLRAGLAPERLVVFQVVEYLRGFIQGRLGCSWLNGLLVISGAFGIFRTDVLRAVGGYSTSTVSEDMEVVVRIHRYFREQRQPYKVAFMPDSVCWTEVPNRMALLGQQRRRWQRGLAEVLTIHRALFFRPHMGAVGFAVLPQFALECIAPVIELIGFVFMPLAGFLGWVSPYYLLIYLILALLLGITFSIWTVAIEEFTFRRYGSWRDLLRLLVFAVLENLGYHQFVLWSRFKGLYDYFRGRRDWGKQVRIGFRRSRPSLSSGAVVR